MKFFTVNDLSVSYGKQQILSHLSLETKTSETIGILGANGSGKTTFFKCLLRETKYHGYIVDNDMKYVFMPEKVRFPYVLSILDYFKMFLEK